MSKWFSKTSSKDDKNKKSVNNNIKKTSSKAGKSTIGTKTSAKPNVKQVSKTVSKTDSKTKAVKTDSNGKTGSKSKIISKSGNNLEKKTVRSDIDETPKTESQSSSTSSGSQASEKSNKSLGMGTSLRMTSTDIRQITKDTQNVGSAAKLTAEGGSPPGQSVYDTIAYVIYCSDHQKIAIGRSDKDKTSWLPFIASPLNKTWRDATIDGLSIIFNKEDAELDAKLGTKIPIKEMQCLHVYRTQSPTNQVFVSLVIQCVILGKNTQTFQCCQPRKRIQWLPINEVIKGNIDQVWGPEVQDFSRYATKKCATGLTEQSLLKAFVFVPKGNKPRNEEQALLLGAGIGHKEAESLYADFIEHCFPSLSMSLDSLKDYLAKHVDSWEKSDPKLTTIFRACNYKRNNCINFHEFLIGMAAMDPKAPSTAAARARFIFRWYDTDGDLKLSREELRQLIKAVSIGSDDKSVDAKVTAAIQAMGGKDSVNANQFCKGIANKVLGSTSSLCRAPKSIVQQITQSQANQSEKKSEVMKKAGFLMHNRKDKGLCFGCRGKKYDYGLHNIKLDTNGRCVEPRRIFEPDNHKEYNHQDYSMDFTFNTRSIGNTFIDLIRDFKPKKGSAKSPKGFMQLDPKTLIKYIESLSLCLSGLFTSDDRIVKLNAPAFIFGDLFGNLDDLMTYEHQLWQTFPIVSSHYLFLGNYVDYGKWGVECALYLFALKLLAPTKFILLRGSHETRKQQKKCTFHKECLSKYGKTDGPIIWEMINALFDKLPLATVIDETIFCTNSGVPTQANKTDDISKIPADLKEPETHPIAKELLTGKPNANGVKQMLHKFGHQFMICGNQVSKSGYNHFFDNKCVTVFSCSHFCGQNNQSAAVFVDNGTIRIIQLDTSKNQPATDPK